MKREVVGNVRMNQDGKLHSDTSHELIAPAVEIRLVDLKKDAEAIADIFNQSTAIEHLAGIAPAWVPINFRDHIEDYIPLIPRLGPEGSKLIADNLVVAIPDEIKAFYSRMSNYNVETYVAEIRGKVVGTASLQRPRDLGLWGFIFKVAVSSEAPKIIETSQHGKGIARSLIKFIHNRMFSELCYTGAAATMIPGVEGELAPMSLFRKEGYLIAGETSGIVLGWDNKEEKFVDREILLEYNAPSRFLKPHNNCLNRTLVLFVISALQLLNKAS